MRKLLCLIAVSSVAVSLVGCNGGGEDKGLETAAPPPSANATPSTPNPNKKSPGAAGMSGGSGPGAAAGGATQL
jgi:hypothetical protein